MTLIERIYSELETALESNPSSNVPYHNNRHMNQVWIIAKDLLHKEQGATGGDPWDTTTLMIASMLHDWGHSAGREKDSVNIQVAIGAASTFMDTLEVQLPEDVKKAVLQAIACTQYPFIVEPTTMVEKVLRDADLLYATLSGDPKIVLECLRSEISTSMGRWVSYDEMISGQLSFMDQAKLFTSSGKRLWDGHAREFIDRMKGTRPVRILTSELSGIQLRVMLALAIGRNPKIIGAEYGVGSRVLIEGDRGYFRPDADWSQLGALLDVYWRHSTSWLISHFGPNWRDNIDGTKGSIQIWFCRGIVGSHLGDEVECFQFDN